MSGSNKTKPGKASQGTVVAVAANSAAQQKVYPTLIELPVVDVGEKPVSSALPVGVRLNGPAEIQSLEAPPEQPGQAASNAVEIEDRAKPTADLLKGKPLGFKTGSKMIIRVDLGSGVEGSGQPSTLSFNHFSLQAATESDEERYQLHETFAEEVLFLFGRRPRIWTLAGIVVNAKDADHATELAVFYEQSLRGTRTVDLRGSRTFIFYEDVLLECTLLNMTMVRNSSTPSAVNVSITIVIHDRAYVGSQDNFLDQNIALLQGESQDIVSGKPVPDRILRSAATEEEIQARADAADAEQALLQQNVSESEKRRSDALAAVEELNRSIGDKAADIAAAKGQLAFLMESGQDTGSLESEISKMEDELRTLEANRQAAAVAAGLEGQSAVEDAADLASASAKSDALAASAPKNDKINVYVTAALFKTGVDESVTSSVSVWESTSATPEGQQASVPALSSSGAGSGVFKYSSANEAVGELRQNYGVLMPRGADDSVSSGRAVSAQVVTFGRRIA